ncbi:rhodanese-like domain-containing protein [Ruegeria marina]|uniref:Rhodanese-related sulfurtransferase n=1 Tax=Ruegeria marina TaxID=639004 RepID=A0A1G6L4Q0_9RHOB|nr:rhodanese-like domain-containing protein [Ruegeria marina]SDC38194.1 Rhodanese-related sulfurtransferase [Ruegeria marina]
MSQGVWRRIGLGLLAALAVGFAVRQYLLTPQDFAGSALTVSEAHVQATAGEVLLIDIRRPEEWRATGIGEGAYPLDMRRPDFIQALTELAEGDRTRRIALICARGVRSARLANRLSDAGFGNVIDVPEGMLGSRAGPGWVWSKLPVTAYAESNS